MFDLAPSNYDLFLTSLINFRGNNVTEMDGIRSQIINATMCSEPSDLCYLQECKIFPGIKGITFHVLKLQDIDGTEEITHALWDNGNLIKKTASIFALKDELSVWTIEVSTHMYVKKPLPIHWPVASSNLI